MLSVWDEGLLRLLNLPLDSNEWVCIVQVPLVSSGWHTGRACDPYLAHLIFCSMVMPDIIASDARHSKASMRWFCEASTNSNSEDKAPASGSEKIDRDMHVRQECPQLLLHPRSTLD